MDEQELRWAFRTAFDGLQPGPGAVERAFDVTQESRRERGLGLRLASAAALVVSALVVTTLLAGRTVLTSPQHAPSSTRAVPATQPAPEPLPAGLPSSSPQPDEQVNPMRGRVLAALDGRTALVGGTGPAAVQLTVDGGRSWTTVRALPDQRSALYDLQWVDGDTAMVATSVGLYRFQRSTRALTEVSPRGDLARLDFIDQDTGYAVTVGGEVVSSADGGASFAPVDVGIRPVNWIQWVSATRAWAAGPAGVVATLDGGATWRSQLAFTPAPAASSLTAQVGFRDESNGFAVFAYPGSVMNQTMAVVYHTSDGGLHWVAESCTCAYIPVPDWLRQGASPGLPSSYRSELTVTGPAQAALVASDPSIRTSICTTGDAGRRWTCRLAPFSGEGSGSLSVKGRTWWVVADVAGPGGPRSLVVVSQDGGATWTVHDLDPPA